MPDMKLIRDDRHEPHPAGRFTAVCADFIDLGQTVEQFDQNPPEEKDKVALVFRTDAQRGGKPQHISQEFTASMGPKAKLRRFFEAWLGRTFTNAEARKGIHAEEFVGVVALVTVEHRISNADNTYAVIASIEPLPAKMAEDLPSLAGYERAPFWQRRKQEYADKVKAFRQQQHHKAEPPPSDGEGDDSDLPF